MKDINELFVDMDEDCLKHMLMKNKRSKKYKNEIFKYPKNVYRK